MQSTAEPKSVKIILDALDPSAAAATTMTTIITPTMAQPLLGLSLATLLRVLTAEETGVIATTTITPSTTTTTTGPVASVASPKLKSLPKALVSVAS